MLPDYIEARIERAADDCWNWTGCLNDKGYGLISFGGRNYRAHRIVWELFNGPFPRGLEADHLCRNRRCVNPAHIEPVTHQENMRRGNGGAHFAAKTHCPQGHPYAGDNLYTRSDGARVCKACWYGRIKAWKVRNRERYLKQEREAQRIRKARRAGKS
jgi:hypothetical protein